MMHIEKKAATYISCLYNIVSPFFLKKIALSNAFLDFLDTLDFNEKIKLIQSETK